MYFLPDQIDHLQFLYPITSLICWSLFLEIGVAFSVTLSFSGLLALGYNFPINYFWRLEFSSFQTV